MKTIMLPRYIRNTGKLWKQEEARKLKELARKNTPTRVIGLLLGRSEESIRAKAYELGISLKPTNQSPYTRRK